MVKVLYVVPDGMDLGGIITSSEDFMRGFREAGHEATFCLLGPTKNVTDSKSVSGDSSKTTRRESWRDASNWTKSDGSGMWMHPVWGWRGPWINAALGVDTFTRLAREHDVVVWGAVNGLKSKGTNFSGEWLKLFQTGRPNVVVINDDHVRDRYLWIAKAAPWVTAWSSVHPIGYGLCEGLGRRAVVFSCHSTKPVDGALSKDREDAVFSCQTFKRWKRVDRLVAAAPRLIAGSMNVTLAGAGIEYYYMTSKDKCRPVYDGIWQRATDAGMRYLGAVKEDARDKCLLRHKFFIDLSYRPAPKESSERTMFNRTTIEAMRHGCIPMGVPEFLSGRADGRGSLFTAFEHYLPVSHGCSPDELAKVMLGYMNYTSETLHEMRVRNLEFIKKFDRRVAADQLVQLGLKQAAGQMYSDDHVNSKLIARGVEQFHAIFK